MSQNYYHDISRDLFIENLRSLRTVSESNVYHSLIGESLDLDSVFINSVNASKHGHELGFTTEYITMSIRFAFEAGVKVAVDWLDKHDITINSDALTVWKGVIK